MTSKRESDGKGLTAYLGHVLSPVSFDKYEDYRRGALIVDAAGKVVFCGSADQAKKDFAVDTTVDCGRRLIMPGFVDLHVHLAQIAQVGKAGDTLLGWLSKYIFPAEAKFASADHAEKLSRWFFRELAANGTTLAAVFPSLHPQATDIAFSVAAEFGSRVIMGKVLMDQFAPAELTESCEDGLRSSEELCRRWHDYDDGRLLYAFTPRFVPTSSQELLRGVGALWRKFPGTYMQTHTNENLEEIAWVRERFPEYRDYVDVYHQHGLSGNNSIFAHCIHLSDDELKTLVDTGSAAAHCPSSNFFLKSGVFPYARCKNAGLRFGLGSDVAGGPELSIFRVMRDAEFIQPETWIAPGELFYLATLGGAKAVNLDHKVGCLKPGMEADFIVVDPERKSGLPEDLLDHATDEILSSLVYVGDDRNVVRTYVRGRCIYDALQESALLVGTKAT